MTDDKNMGRETNRGGNRLVELDFAQIGLTF